MHRSKGPVGTRQVNRGGKQIHPVRGLDDQLCDVDRRGRLHEGLGPCALEILRVKTEREGGTCLGIEIDDQDALPACGKGRPDIDHRGRLGHATLLIGDCQDPSHLTTIGLRWFERRSGGVGHRCDRHRS